VYLYLSISVSIYIYINICIYIYVCIYIYIYIHIYIHIHIHIGRASADPPSISPPQVKKLKDYAGHGFKYGGASSQINKMKMKEKMAEKLELAQADMDDEAAALMEVRRSTYMY